MAEALSTFSESWYRVANLRLGLRPHVQVHRQFFRGRRWYVVQDPFNNQFFRLQPAAYEFVARLRPSKTVEEVWTQCMERDPQNAPGQEDIIRLLSQLYFANLLQYDLPGDSRKLFERYKQRRQREVQSWFLNIMFARFPLLDPDEFLNRWNPLIGRLISKTGAVLWLLVVGFALKIVIDRFPSLAQQSQGILAPSNLFLLYVGLILTKAVHEFGHAFVCKRFGGEVHVMGIMLLIFTPIPYMDATSSWAFRNRWHRVLVGASGMLVEIFLAACATFVWASTSPGVLHSLAYNMMFIASVSTVLFNANPLLRFDGYYILSDLLDIPNLHSQATGHLRHLAERYLFGWRKSESPAETTREAVWLTVFGILSGIYRVVVFTGILLFVADRFLLAGIIMAIVCAISWVLVPIFKFLRYLATSPRLERSRPRAIAVTLGLVGIVVLFLSIIPFPHRFRAPGILRARQYAYVVNGASGYLDEVLVPSGTTVVRGTPLMRLHNSELELLLSEARAQHEETEALYRRALERETADLKPVEERKQAIEQQIARLLEEQAGLTVLARQEGVWVALDLDDYVGSWVERGTAVGQIINPEAFEFISTVDQSDASLLFEQGEMGASTVRLYGQAEDRLMVVDQKIIPAEREVLPSVALGWLGGGEVAVDVQDRSGLRTAEPFFEVRSGVEPDSTGIAMLHGRTGKIRFQLTPKPLLNQWIRRLRQLLQRRYQM
jgi:putative peptide zinc metalloprotease protein